MTSANLGCRFNTTGKGNSPSPQGRKAKAMQNATPAQINFINTLRTKNSPADEAAILEAVKETIAKTAESERTREITVLTQRARRSSSEELKARIATLESMSEEDYHARVEAIAIEYISGKISAYNSAMNDEIESKQQASAAIDNLKGLALMASDPKRGIMQFFYTRTPLTLFSNYLLRSGK